MKIVPGWKNIRERIRDKTGVDCSIKLAKCIRDRDFNSLNENELEIAKAITKPWSFILDGDEIDSIICVFQFMLGMLD